jgi:hypothetical protein
LDKKPPKRWASAGSVDGAWLAADLLANVKKPLLVRHFSRPYTPNCPVRDGKGPFLLVSPACNNYIAAIEDCERLCLRATRARQISFNVDIQPVECLTGQPND